MTGEFDYLVDNKNEGEFHAIVETNRGCPYLCAFCNSPTTLFMYKGKVEGSFFRKKTDFPEIVLMFSEHVLIFQIFENFEKFRKYVFSFF